MSESTPARGTPSGRGDASAGDGAAQRVIVDELERRLMILETVDEDALGRFGALDWAVCVAGFVILPLLLVWWAA